MEDRLSEGGTPLSYSTFPSLVKSLNKLAQDMNKLPKSVNEEACRTLTPRCSTRGSGGGLNSEIQTGPSASKCWFPYSASAFPMFESFTGPVLKQFPGLRRRVRLWFLDPLSHYAL